MSSLFAANPVDAAALAEQLARFRVIPADRLTERLAEFPGGGPELLADLLVRRGDLTPFQANRALAGESRSIALGPYRLLGFAGLGTFGPAYVASHRDTPGMFRVHTFPLRSLWRARQAKQLARTLAKIEHPALVPLADADSANGLHYLAWPLVEGTTLSTRLAAGPLWPAEVVHLLATLAAALHTCHAGKVAHGAMTPGAVLFDTQGEPRLLDLGAGAILTSNLEDEESLLDTLSGSSAAVEIIKFAAPELVGGRPATAASDQYALGAIGYFALTGEAPFAAASLADVLESKTRRKPNPLAPDVPAELVAAIERMLLPAAEERFPGLDEVHARLVELGRRAEPPGEPPAAEGQFFNAQPSAAAGASWSSPQAVLEDLPTRDDSEASINFELPPPPPETVGPPASPPSAPAVRAMETPSQHYEETESVRRQDGIRPKRMPEGEAEPLAALPPVGLQACSIPASDATDRVEADVRPQGKPVDALAAPIASSPVPAAAGASGSPSVPPPPGTRPGNVPRSGIKPPVQYHTQQPGATGLPPQPVDEAPVTDSILWRKVKRSLLFWQTPLDILKVSIYGPASVSPGQPAKLSVYLHTEDTTENVRTLSRAFHHDAELIGCGVVAQEVARDTQLAVHLSVANAGITKSLQKLTWLGQPHRLMFELHVPWESPAGPAPGLLSIGREDVRIGKVEFRLSLLPRKG